MSKSPIRRLFFDIETSPNVVLSWRVGYKININYENLLKERSIICIGYKWQGDKRATVLAWDRDQSDKKLLQRFIKELSVAHEAIGHNIDSFDLPWVKTRCLFHGLPTIPDVKTADTLQWAKRRFYFNSNRLDYIAKYLGIGAKIKTEFNLWKDILLNHDGSALETMKRYCAFDVILLEQVWERLEKICPIKTHLGALYEMEKWSCPRCASDNVIKWQRIVTAYGTPQQKMKCNDCGGYYRISDQIRRRYDTEKKRTTKVA